MITKFVSRGKIQLADYLTSEDLANFTREDDISEVMHLESFLYSAIDYAETYMNRYLSEVNLIASWNTNDKQILLPYVPISITSLKEANTNTDVPFTFNNVTGVLTLESEFTEFYCEYKAGWTSEQVPASVIHGLRKLVATMNESREDDIYGVSVNRSTFNCDRFFDLYRIRSTN